MSNYTKSRPWSRTKAFSDTVTLTLLAIFIFALASIFDFSNALGEGMRRHEEWVVKGDEIAIASVFLAVACAVFSLRRWRELKQGVLERKSAEDVLSESEERFRSLIENASDIITILDKDGAVCYHSPSIERVLQYKAESAIGKSVFGFIHPDDLPDAIKTFKHAVEQRSVGPTVEYRCRHRDGSWRVLESIGKPVFKNSEVTAVVVNSRDITERKQADEALRQSERDYRELFEQAHDAILILTPEDEIVLDVNQRACEIYGFNREEFIGLSIESISQNVPRGKEQIQQTLSKGSYLNFETIQLRKDGSEMALEINAATISYKGQQAILSINRDITKRQRAEKALQDSEHKYRTLIEQASDGIMISDREGNIEEVNSTACRELGYTREEVVGLKFTNLMPADELAAAPIRWSELLTGNIIRGERRVRHKNGSLISVEISAKLLDAGRLQVFARDITERKRAEEELRKAHNELEAKVAERTTELREANERLQDELAARTQAQEALRKGEARYRTLIEAMPAIVYVAEPEPPYAPLYVSPDIESLGYSLEEWQHNTDLWMKLLHPQDREWVMRETAEAMAAGSETDYEYKVVTRDGSVRWLHDRGRFVRDEMGLATSWLGVMLDITERKSIERALIESEKRYRNLVDNSQGLICTHDLSGCLLSVNPAAATLLGYRPAEMVGHNLREFLAPEKQSYFPAYLEQIRQSSTFNGLMRVQTKGGEKRIWSFQNTCYGDGEKDRYVLGHAHDVTDLKRVERALRASEERYRLIVENANDIIYRTDAEGHFTYTNPTFRKMLKCSEEESPGIGYLDVVHPDYRAAAEKFYAQQRFKGIYDTYYELPIVATDGTEIWIGQNVQPILEQNQVVGFQSVARDITQRKRAEEMLQKEQEFLHAVLENITDGIVACDAEGVLTLFNRASRDFHGLPVEQLPSEEWAERYDLFLPDGQTLMQPEQVPLYRALRGEIVHDAEIVIAPTHSLPRRLVANGRAIFDTEGRKLGAVVAMHDITERKLAEQALRQAYEELELRVQERTVQLARTNKYLKAEIKERLLVEEALRNSEARLRRLVESNIIGVLFPDLSGNVTEANDAFLQMSGYTRQDLIAGKIRWDEMTPPEYLAVDLKAIGQLRTYGFTDPFEKEYIRKDGSRIPVLLGAAMLEGSQDKCVAFVLDLTERKKTEEKLRQSEEWLKAIFEASRDGILVEDNEHIVYVNRSYASLLGYDNPEDLIGKHMSFTLPPDEAKRLAEFGKRRFRGEDAPSVYESKGKRKDNSLIDLEASVSQSIIADKVYITTMVRDIAERKSIESARRESEDRFRQITETIREVFWMTETDKNQMIYISPGYEEVWGRTRQSLYANPLSWVDNIYGEDRERVLTAALTKQAQGIYNEQYRIVRSDGEIRWIQDRAFPVRDEAGEVYRIAGIADDITERKLAEEQIKASLKEKEVLLKEIHHRVKNNLQIISSLLKMQSRNVKDEQAQAIFNDSQNRVRSMALIHEKLYQSENLAEIDFAGYARSLAINLFRSYGISEEVVTLRLDVENVLLGVDTAIPCGLILNELVSNSLKYAFPSNRKGEILIHLYKDAGDKYTLVVGDNGVGIPKDLDYRNTESMGLQLVNTLSEQLEGNLELHNSGGTRFELTFTQSRRERG